MKKQTVFIQPIIAESNEDAMKIYNHYPAHFKRMFPLLTIRRKGTCVYELIMDVVTNRVPLLKEIVQIMEGGEQ